MAKYKYEDKKFRPQKLEFISTLNRIVTEFTRQGYVLTVRQLYYQLVAKDLIENNFNSYKNTAATINDGKMAGLIDWDAIEDRGRRFVQRPHWQNGREILMGSANQYYEDMWVNQDQRVVVVIEKEALFGVLEGVCRRFDVPLLAAKGYPSSSVLRSFSQEYMLKHMQKGQHIKILHLGDHDPSGIDMTRDLMERFQIFSHTPKDSPYLSLERLALNMDQIEELKPPKNYAKSYDPRFKHYSDLYGDSSWELDALTPSYLNNLVEQNIVQHIDPDCWVERKDRIEAVKARIKVVAENFKVGSDEI